MGWRMITQKGKNSIMEIITAKVLLDDNKIPVLIKEEGKKYPNIIDFSNPDNIVTVMNEEFKLDCQIAEFLYLIALDNQCKPLFVFEVNKGDVGSAIVDIRGIMMRLLLSNASRFVLIHNHVSGEAIPSKMDIDTTKKIQDAATVMGVEMCDHIIIGKNKYTSFREEMLLFSSGIGDNAYEDERVFGTG